MALPEVMAAVLTTARDALDPAPELVALVPGAEVAWDDGCSQVWVRLASIEPRYAGGRCPFGMSLTLGVGVVRCVATLDDSGNPPSSAQVDADGRASAADADALYAALADYVPFGAESARLGAWTPLGPNGGTAGGEWTLVVLVTG